MAKQFFRNCRFDVCMHIDENNKVKRDLVCKTMDEFEQMCIDEGYDVDDWRESKKCRKCLI